MPHPGLFAQVSSSVLPNSKAGSRAVSAAPEIQSMENKCLGGQRAGFQPTEAPSTRPGPQQALSNCSGLFPGLER